MKRLLSGLLAASLIAAGHSDPAYADESASSGISSGSAEDYFSSASPLENIVRVVSVVSLIARLPQFVTDLQTLGNSLNLPAPAVMVSDDAPGSSDYIRFLFVQAPPNNLAEPHHMKG